MYGGCVLHSVLVVVRVERGAPRPSEQVLRAALRGDRSTLKLGPEPEGAMAVGGPYAVRVNGQDVDEYVVWER